MQQQGYKYNATDDSLTEFNKCFTSRIGDGAGDPEESFLSCVKLLSFCKSGGNFLDIGAGIGRISQLILPYALSIVALEPDPDRFRSCRQGFRNDRNVEVLNVSSSTYNQGAHGRKFDLIILSMVQQHVSTRQSHQILQDVRELLAPGGIAVVATTHFPEEIFLYERRSVRISASEFDDYAENPSGQGWGIPVRMFSRRSFCDALRRAQLDMVIWQQFFYVRPERVAAIAGLYGISADAIRDIGISQFAVASAALRTL